MARFAPLLLILLAASAGCSERSPASKADDSAVSPDRRTPQNASELQLSFAPVAERAAPAVVNISAQTVRQANPYFDLFGGRSPEVAQSAGSGVIVRADGVIVTNNHVIEGAQAIRVSLTDRREFPARVVLADPRTDLAVLKIDTGGAALPALRIDVEQPRRIGDLVLAIGNPFGVGQTVTSGIISATDRSNTGLTDLGSFIQTDAAINPGNSGGPLVDMDGEVIGINTAILSQSGASSGVGFAVPAALVQQVVAAAERGERTVPRPYLGVAVRELGPEGAQALNLQSPDGVLIEGVARGSPADRAGLRPGDVITGVNGGAVGDPSALNFLVATASPGDTVSVQVSRQGRALAIPVRVELPPR